MKTMRANAKKILGVTAVVVAITAGAALGAGHATNIGADQGLAVHHVAGVTSVAKMTPLGPRP